MAINNRMRWLRLFAAGILTAGLLPGFAGCDTSFNGNAGLPDFYTYISGSVPVEKYGITDFSESRYQLEVINPALTPGAAPQGEKLPPIIALRWQPDNFSAPQAALFSSDLDFIMSSNDIRGNPPDDYWIFSETSSWQYRLDSSLDLGRSRFSPHVPWPVHLPLMQGTRRYESTSRFYPLPDGSREYQLAVEGNSETDTIELRLLAAWDGDSSATVPGDERIPLLENASGALTTELERIGRPDYINIVQDISRVSLHSIFTYGEGTIAIAHFSDGWDAPSLFVVFFLESDPRNSIEPAYTLLPSIQYEAPVFMFDGSYVATVQPPPGRRFWDYTHEERLRNLQLTGYKLGENSLGDPSSYDYTDIFGNARPGRDLSLHMLTIAGKWYIFQRRTMSIYALSLGEGGWE